MPKVRRSPYMREQNANSKPLISNNDIISMINAINSASGKYVKGVEERAKNPLKSVSEALLAEMPKINPKTGEVEFGLGMGAMGGVMKGVKAANADLGQRDIAQKLLDAGSDPEKVRKETGWFKLGKDLMYDDPDIGFSMDPNNKEGKSLFNPSEGELDDFIQANKKELSETDKYLGGWDEGSDRYIDISKQHKNYKDAMKSGMETKQIAGYDLNQYPEFNKNNPMEFRLPNDPKLNSQPGIEFPVYKDEAMLKKEAIEEARRKMRLLFQSPSF